MSRRFSSLRPGRGLLLVFGTSAIVGGAYRYWKRDGDDELGNHLNPSTFTPYSLLSKQTVTPTSSIFVLGHGDGRAHDAGNAAIADIRERGVWSVQAKQPELQIARSYTPLPSSEDSEPGHLRFLIRAEKNGEVSNYLHALPTSSNIALRGPFLDLDLPEDLKEVIFIAGGTGIAPALQVADILSKRPGARMHILWNTRHRDECQGGKSETSGATNDDGGKVSRLAELDPWTKISRWTAFGLSSGGSKPESALHSSKSDVISDTKSLIVQELEVLKSRFESTQKNNNERVGGLTIEYFVDDDNRFVKPRDVARQLRLVAQQEEKDNLTPGKKLILVSGPDGFLELWAGKKVWIGGKEMQGPLNGYFSNLGLARQGWRVWKL